MCSLASILHMIVNMHFVCACDLIHIQKTAVTSKEDKTVVDEQHEKSCVREKEQQLRDVLSSNILNLM